MSPSVRVDSDVYDFLRKRAEPFIDTPNSVLRRLLGLEDSEATRPSARRSRSGAQPGHEAKRRRRRRGSARRPAPSSLLPQDEYVGPILDAIVAAGGAAPTQTILQAVGQRLQSKFHQADRERLPTGGIRWQNRAQWVRLRLVEEGLLSKDSPRGIWQVTDQGRSRARARASA